MGVSIGGGTSSLSGAIAPELHALDRLPTSAAGFDLNPLHDLAEKQNPAFLRSRYGSAGTHGPTAKLYAAWSRIECALHPQIAETSAQYSRDNLFSSAERFLRITRISEGAGLAALLASDLLAYQSALKFRSLGMPDEIRPAAMHRLYGDLIHTLTTTDQTLPSCGQLGEILFQAAAARVGVVVFPSSPREEAASGTARVWNHDLYRMREKGKKPIQIKTNETDQKYVPPVVVVRVDQLARQALGKSNKLKKTDLPDSDPDPSPTALTRMQFERDYRALLNNMRAEHRGWGMSTDRKRALNRFSELIVASTIEDAKAA